MAKQHDIHLVTALGNRELILELLDFFDFTREINYPADTIEVRELFRGWKLKKLHLFCTQFSSVQRGLRSLTEEMAVDFPSVELKPIQLDMEDIATSADDKRMKDIVNNYLARLPGERTVISSAGRKTLTQRILEAAMKYGCLGYLTLIGPDNMRRDEYHKIAAIWTPSKQLLQERWKYGKELNRDTIGSSFRSLSILPIMVQNRLYQEKIGRKDGDYDAELDWLRRLPKADLHCHLGGCQDEKQLKELAAQLLVDFEVTREKEQEVLSFFCEKLHLGHISEITPESLAALSDLPPLHCLQNLELLFADYRENKHLLAAVLINSLDISTLCSLSRSGRVNSTGEIDWPAGSKDSLKWYMSCGDLGGSTLLQSEETLRLSLRRLMEDSVAENIRYLEVRCSPANYTKAGLLSINMAMDSLLAEAESFMTNHPDFRVNFLVMATRHKSKAEMVNHVAAAILYGENQKEGVARVVGFDLAGQEQGYDPVNFQDVFMPLHRNFMNITIHAGEMTDEDKIWQAIYLLHAKRIGHGLKLVDNRRMMDFVRDHGMILEMCPLSNMQTNSFPLFPDESSGGVYPLHKYLEAGLEVTINTDNRFISDTSLSKEYWQAGAMSPSGLSRWQILSLIRSSFQAAFLAKDDKDRLLKKIDDEIFSLLLEDYLAPSGS